MKPKLSFAVSRRDLSIPHGGRSAGEWTAAAWWQLVSHRLLTGAWVPRNDVVKYWDAKNVVEHMDGMERKAAVLDCGAYCSASLHWLRRSGFTNLYGIDLNSTLGFLPSSTWVRYSVQDIQETSFPDASFDSVICASVIEHGVSWGRFLTEARRLLRPGGLLYVSTDLVSQDQVVSAKKAFGLSWNPLRPGDIAGACELIASAGFHVPSPSIPRIDEELPCEFLGVRCGFVAFVCYAC